jgi:hypothetical protein
MEHTEIINTFSRTIKATLEAGAMYFFDHPLFVENLEALHQAIHALLSIADPIRIGFTPSGLIIGETTYDDQLLYSSLGYTFHSKKVKALSIRSGVTIQELKAFLTCTGMQSKDILKAGGINKILAEKALEHITIEELDYTELLQGEGQDCEDVWTYMLSDAVDKNNKEAIDKYATNFRALMKKYKLNSLMEDPEARENMEKFLSFLQKNSEEKYKDCAKEILKSAVKDQRMTDEVNVKNLSTFIKSLNPEDLADTIWNEIISEDNVDSLNLNLFSQLMDTDTNDEIAESLQKKIEKSTVLLKAPRVRNRIKDLFSGSSSSYIPKSYRHFLTLALEKISTVGTMTYDRHHAEINYCAILASLIPFEKDPARLKHILGRIDERWEKIVGDSNIYFLFDLYSGLQTITGIDDEEARIHVQDTTLMVENHIDELIYEGRINIKEFDKISSSFSSDKEILEKYYDKFFNENKVNPFMLRLLLFISRHNIEIFYYHLEMKKRSINFIRKVIDLAKCIPQKEEAAYLLRQIYSFSKNFIKVKVLQEMAALGICDEEIILPLLEKTPYHIKIEAMRVAMSDKELLHKALYILFSKPSLLGLKAHTIRANIKIVDTLNIQEAKNDIEALASLDFFWNKGIRADALKLLEKWNNE